MKNILVLYPGLAGQRGRRLGPHRLRLRLAGYRLLLADDRTEPADHDLFAETLLLPAAEEVAPAWAALLPFIESRRIDAVFAQSEPSLLLGALAARHLGLPGPSVDAALAATSKLATRIAVEKAGIDQPEFALARDSNDVRRIARRVGWPVVLKAVASSRQRLVTLVARPDDVEPAVARLRAALPDARDVRRLVGFCELTGASAGCDPTSEFLVESYAAGDVIEEDGILNGYRKHSLGVCEQVALERQRFFIRGYLLPTDRPATLVERIERQTTRALEALGMSDTGYSVEYRVDGDRASLIEVNGRLAWDDGLSELFDAAGGNVPSIVAARVALGQPVGDLSPRRHAAVAYRSCDAEAIVERVPTGADLRRLRRQGIDCAVHVVEGERLRALVDVDSRPHLMHALATDPRSSRAAYERAAAALDTLELVSRPPTPADESPGALRQRPRSTAIPG